jgi:hypothetical protein
MSNYKTEGYVAADGSVRVSVREPGRGWHQSPNQILTKAETEALIVALTAALREAEAAA